MRHDMDDIRDSRKPDSLLRFLDNHTVKTNPFGQNTSGEKAYRRAERLVAALHLLTAHVQESEPVKHSIRAKAIKLLSDILALRDEMRVPNSSRIHATQITIRELISLTRLLAVSGVVSTQNADVIVEAEDELGNFLQVSQRSPLSESTVISREGLLSAVTPEKRTGSLLKDRLPRAINQKDMVLSDNTDETSIKDRQKDTSNFPSSRTDKLGARAQAIIGVLKSGGEIGIRDISSNLPEYSEKMIQRELASLVPAGVVKKVGLKRWSRYSIAGS
jgi:hypothetical protein